MFGALRAGGQLAAKAFPSLAGVGATLSGINGLEFGRGGLVQHPPGSTGSWGDYFAAQRGATGGNPNDAPKGDSTGNAVDASPFDRIKAAFEQLRGQGYGSMVQDKNGPAQMVEPGVYGPDATMMGGGYQQPQPMQPPLNLNAMRSVTVPDRAPAPQPEGGGDAPGFFMRNAMMQRAAPGGEYLDPTLAAKAGGNPIMALLGAG